MRIKGYSYKRRGKTIKVKGHTRKGRKARKRRTSRRRRR